MYKTITVVRCLNKSHSGNKRVTVQRGGLQYTSCFICDARMEKNNSKMKLMHLSLIFVQQPFPLAWNLPARVHTRICAHGYSFNLVFFVVETNIII